MARRDGFRSKHLEPNFCFFLVIRRARGSFARALSCYRKLTGTEREVFKGRTRPGPVGFMFLDQANVLVLKNDGRKMFNFALF